MKAYVFDGFSWEALDSHLYTLSGPPSWVMHSVAGRLDGHAFVDFEVPHPSMVILYFRGRSCCVAMDAVVPEKDALRRLMLSEER